MVSREKTIHLRLTEEEENLLKRRQNYLHFDTISQMLRAFSLSPISFEENYLAVDTLLSEISSIKNNLNQILLVLNNSPQYSVEADYLSSAKETLNQNSIAIFRKRQKEKMRIRNKNLHSEKRFKTNGL